MSSLLAALRKSPQPAPARFLAAHPGCWVQYFDDTPARDASKALAARRFDPDTARRKQGDACAVCFSLQAFGTTRTKEGLLTFRNLGVDVDLVPPAERGSLAPAEIDRRKEDYLTRHLLPFPLKPHWLTETRHGFHVIFRVKPVRGDGAVREAQAVSRRLVRALRGDENAALLTQVLRVPGTFQFKDPDRPFLCRLLMDNASVIAPYDLDTVRGILDALGVFQTEDRRPAEGAPPAGGTSDWSRRWRERLAGVTEGQRNATAASVVGGIVARLPEEFWETAGWGGLKEWNTRNAVPLRERELRSVYESIARRERAKRRSAGDHRPGGTDAWTGGRVRVTIRTGGRQPQTHQIEFEKSPYGRNEPDIGGGSGPRPVPPSPPC
ncbi:MAG TPA: primase alpha helix C-terminal domain-containing protein [Urbifossiella sp.]|nr:primase alpha helix C-terminal domain-containing protein [Urbifossiella sp.]